MGKIRFICALWAARMSMPLLKLTRHKGTNFPGELAIKLCPDFLHYIGKPARVIAVTGTNGKTTVSNMLCDVLEASGEKVLHNRYGSNIITGICTSLISGSDWLGRTKFKTAVLEIDERSTPRVFPHVKPEFVVITNLFRDSIMRNAHPEYIADLLTNWMPAESKLILNSDDLISSSVAPDNERVYFGIAPMSTDVAECNNLINDVRVCPKCSGKLNYEYRRYHHIGRAHCECCGFGSHDYDYFADIVDLNTMTMRFEERKSGESAEYRLLSDSVFNVYNMVAVITMLRQLGMSHERIHSCLEGVSIVESRYNVEAVGNVRVIMHMAKEKNALACSRAFDYVSSREGSKELFLMMNCLGDVKHWSENTCWLYDCDFEFLKREDIKRIVCTGARAKDYRLRLLFAGVSDDIIRCEPNEFEAAKELLYTPGDDIYLFYGTDSLQLAYKVRDRISEIAKEAAK